MRRTTGLRTPWTRVAVAAAVLAVAAPAAAAPCPQVSDRSGDVERGALEVRPAGPAVDLTALAVARDSTGFRFRVAVADLPPDALGEVELSYPVEFETAAAKYALRVRHSAARTDVRLLGSDLPPAEYVLGVEVPTEVRHGRGGGFVIRVPYGTAPSLRRAAGLRFVTVRSETGTWAGGTGVSTLRDTARVLLELRGTSAGCR